jgi:hypothetical protein
MYHKVDELVNGVRHPGNYVRPADFEQQLDALLAWGYRTIGFAQWIESRSARTTANLPEKPLIVTFDDGYTCFDTHAWPALRARGMDATVFLVSGQIGGVNAWESDEIELPLLSATRILALQTGRCRSHRSRTDRSPTFRSRTRAMSESRTQLGELLGREVFAYPFSNQNGVVREFFRAKRPGCAVRGKGRMNF